MTGPRPTSPWADSADLVSPDGRYRATVADASEIAMGAPTSGTLVVTDSRHPGRVHVKLADCNPSIVWSSDSRALAVPKWTSGRTQRLAVVSLPGGAVRQLNREFRVLELHAFESGRVRGVDSPVHLPQAFEIAVDDLVGQG